MNKEQVLHDYICAELSRTGVYPTDLRIFQLSKNADEFIKDHCTELTVKVDIVNIVDHDSISECMSESLKQVILKNQKDLGK